MSLNWIICITNTTFILGILGLGYNGYNFLRFLLCLELILSSVGLNFIFFSFFSNLMAGRIFTLFLLALAAAEAAVGLGLFISAYFTVGTVYTEGSNSLRG